MAKLNNYDKAQELADTGSGATAFVRALIYVGLELVDAVREQNVILAEEDECPNVVHDEMTDFARIGDGDVGTIDDEPPWDEPAPWRVEEQAVYNGLPFGSKPSDWGYAHTNEASRPVVMVEDSTGHLRPATKAETLGRIISEKHIKPTDEIKIETDQ